MTDTFYIAADWRSGVSDDPAEAVTAAEVTVSVGEHLLSSILDPNTGETVLGARLPVVVLAEGLTRNWWRLLYEPQRVFERQQERDTKFEARHRLDSFTPGYVFPPIGIWSGGETVMVGTFSADQRFHNKSFLLPRRQPWSVARGPAEEALGSLVMSVLARLDRLNSRYGELNAEWDRILTSVQDLEEREWCTNAGRLGLDPYDADTPDLTRLSAGMSEQLFADVCEAGNVSNINQTCDWVRSTTPRFRSVAPISIKNFGGPPLRDLGEPGRVNGHDGVKLLRSRLGLPLDPKQALQIIFQGADQAAEYRVDEFGAGEVEGLGRRTDRKEVKAAVPARSIRQQRFRMCRTVYLAWRAGTEGEFAATPADTWRQQASRAFAAELLAPATLLKQRYGKTGLNNVAVERLASEWQCPPQIIVHQAKNNRIAVKGVETAAYF